MSEISEEKVAEMLTQLIKENKRNADVLDLIHGVGHGLSEIIGREVEAGHYNHALHLLAPLCTLERAREVLTKKSSKKMYIDYIDHAKKIAQAIMLEEKIQTQGQFPTDPSQFPADMPDILKQILSGNMENMEVRVHEVRRKKSEPAPPTTLN